MFGIGKVYVVTKAVCLELELYRKAWIKRIFSAATLPDIT